MTGSRSIGKGRLRVLAALALAAVLCFGMMPVSAWAADGTDGGSPPVAEPPAGSSEGTGETPAGEDQHQPSDASGEDSTGDTAGSSAASSATNPSASSGAAGSGATAQTGATSATQSSSASSTGGSSKKDDAQSSSKKDDSAELTAEERAYLSEASAGISDSGSAMAGLPGALSSLRAAKSAYDEIADELEALEGEWAHLSARTKILKLKEKACRPAAETAQQELAEIDGSGIQSYAIKEGMTVVEALDRQQQVEEVASDAGARAEILSGQIAQNEKRLAELDKQIADKSAEANEALVAANSCAYAAERCCSEARSGEVDAATALDGLNTNNEEVQAYNSELDAVVSTHRGTRGSAFAELDAWYSDLDERAGAQESRLTFGTGREFALDEEAFVAKWGAVIDAYYAELGNVPLGGYGEYMAREAYKWKIDPRLCAAVSFTESGGGVACIRHCNAWGWGAADSDPYNLASEWGSWEEAITAWHTGMATNSFGLGSAGAIDELGGMYASAPHWTANVVTAMERMEQIAQELPEASNETNLSVAAQK